MSRIVVALGGNALGNNPKEQLDLVRSTVKNLVDLVEAGHEIIITHGNGPQVGIIYKALAAEDPTTTEDDMPFAECGAMSQGYIGYHLQQAMEAEFAARGMRRKVATIISQTEVDKDDPAFKNPTKPIGSFYTEEEAKRLSKESGDVYKEDSGRGWRRVVASPTPKKICELEAIRKMVEEHNIVITCGGGGIPVIKTEKGYEGVAAVIDKDKTAAILASSLDADLLLILTAVDQVKIHFRQPNEESLDKITTEEAQKYIESGEFAAGSMLPKIEACLNFLNHSKDKKAIITSLEDAKDAINGKKGTTIIKKEENKKMESTEKEARRKASAKKNQKRSLTLSAFTIILILTFILAIVTHFLPAAQFQGEELVNGSGVLGATLSQTLLAPVLGFADAIDICLFVLILGAFLKVVNKSAALETGIEVLIKKLKGKELILIPILMFLFSIGGTTYGMLEETVGFYAILSVAMVAAGMDTLVASAVVLLGAGSGVLGSTINPFAVGAAIDALPEGIAVNQGIIIGLGVALWLSTYLISTLFVTLYAKKVIAKKGSTFLSLQEQKDMEETYAPKEGSEKKAAKLDGKQKVTLLLFLLTFVVMIVGFIPWGDFGVTFFANGKFFSTLTGLPLGEWYFQESTLWFLIMTIVIGIVNGMNENELVDTFIDGADDMVGVILVIAIARGASVLMNQTYLDNYIIYNAADTLSYVSKGVFAPLNYILHVGLSVLVPSSSGLASLSTPIMGALADQVGFSVEVTIMEMVAANGLVNLFTPTCGAIMGGLELAKVDYTTWLKWVTKVIIVIAIVNIIILTAAMIML